MPEGPELHLASRFINRVCNGRIFGKTLKSEVSKNPLIVPPSDRYTIAASSRGKEIKVTLSPISSSVNDSGSEDSKSLDILFTFGMSGKFEFQTADNLQKHSHMNFFTDDGGPAMALSFVDYRRFGKWVPGVGFSDNERGPCVLYDYKAFRENVLTHVDSSVFDKPICEVLLNQKYFNGIGNYLRAEILYCAGIPPFVSARSVLAPLAESQNSGVKNETPDVLQLCNILPLEVVALEGSWYNDRDDVTDAFSNWLQCYYQDGMKNISDHNKRTVWYSGPLGPLAPKDGKTRAKKISKKKQKTATPDDKAAEDMDIEDKKKKVSRKRVKTEVETVKEEKDTVEPQAKKSRISTGNKTVVRQEQTNSEGSNLVVPHLTRNQMKKILETKQDVKSQTSRQKKTQKLKKTGKNQQRNSVESVPDTGEKEDSVVKTPLQNGAPYLKSSRTKRSVDVADSNSPVTIRKRRSKAKK